MTEKIDNASAEATEATLSQTAAVPAAKKKPRRWKLTLGVVAAIVVVAGAGFWVWHETPGFCAAICHTPMDPYLETYEQTEGQSGVDKWGNDVASTSGMLAVTHANEAVTCVGCHVPQMSEQVSEGLHWVSGDYEVVENADGKLIPAERSLTDLVAARGIPEEQFCLASGCHVNEDGTTMTRGDLAVETSDLARNPHLTEPHGDLLCSDCHKAHRESVMQCAACHEDAEVPEGWVTPAESEERAKALS